jgi:hypothetical protein
LKMSFLSMSLYDVSEAANGISSISSDIMTDMAAVNLRILTNHQPSSQLFFNQSTKSRYERLFLKD